MGGGPGSYMDGGELFSGASSFCCFASANDACDQTVGCAGPANGCPGDPKPDGCWTINVSDQTSLDIDVQLEPPNSGGEVTRCIKFCLFYDCSVEPVCFFDDVTFGGQSEFAGKSRGKIKIDGSQQWDCITAVDQLHTLRSCYSFNASDCFGSNLHADFSGDPNMINGNGNWLIAGNLDGWKKDIPNSQPSIYVIDILDFGTFVSEWGNTYPTDTPCPMVGPNADINGDGAVTMSDYNKIIKNFLVSSKLCCCGPDGSSVQAGAITEISVNELRQLGYSELISADLNGDGVLNGDDMTAFMQGARPHKPTNDRGGKGLRSGR
jgi:hypothetical protein